MRKSSLQKKRKSEAVKIAEQLALQALRKKYPSNPYPPHPKFEDTTSNGLTKLIIFIINHYGYQAERINSTGRRIDNTEVVTDVIGRSRKVGSVKWIKGSSKKGTADISAVIKGRALKIEVKCKATGDNYQSEDQEKYQAEVERAGGIYIIARDFEGFYTWFKEFVKTDLNG